MQAECPASGSANGTDVATSRCIADFESCRCREIAAGFGLIVSPTSQLLLQVRRSLEFGFGARA
jgi:hypothetical protein